MIKIAHLGLLAALVAAPAFAQSGGDAEQKAAEADAVKQLQTLQSEVGPGKRAFVDEQLELTASEAAKFWPVYDAHQAALEKLNKRRLENIIEYARVWNLGKVTDADAMALAKDAIAIEKDEAAQLEHTFNKLKNAVPAVKAVRYLQLEAKLRAIVRFRQAAQVPFVE